MLNHIRKNPKQLKKIEEFDGNTDTFLVISNTALGDTILSTPAIKSLKKSFPKSKIIALIHKNYIPLFDNFSYIDAIIPFYGGYKKFFQTIKEIKKYKPKTTLIFHGNGPQDIQIAIMSGSNFILKHPTQSKYKRYLSFDFKKEDKHIIEERVDLVRKIGGKNIDLIMEIGELHDKKIYKKYTKYRNFIGFQVGASESYRIWPIQNYIELAKRFIENQEKILITGVKKEFQYTKHVSNSSTDKIINLCGYTNIKELPYLIKQLKFIVVSDTGTMHLAIALKTPTICLFSPSNPNYTGPYQDMNIHKVIKKNGEFVNKKPKKQRSNEAMKLISVNDVYDKYLLLKKEGIIS